MTTLGIIVGNRGFFPSHLCDSGRKTILELLEKLGIGVVILPVDATKFGSVESGDDARKCAELFKKNADKIDGILVTLPNFGDERGVANTIRWSGLNVPVLVHAFNDDAAKMTIKDRRDSFCGKMSVCNNLRQYGIPFTLTTLHTVDPLNKSFLKDLQNFVATCQVVKGLRGLRVGAIGARPVAFQTVRFSEKLFEKSGITVETLDMFELFGWVNKLSDTDPSVETKLKEMAAYVNVKSIPAASLLKMAKFGATVEKWMKQNNLRINTIQCWTAIEEYFGVVPCAVMSMMSNMGISSACEVDVVGAVSMHALHLASNQPSALVDWNNNYGEDADKAVVFHCSNLPKDIFEGGKATMDFQEIIAGSVGKENAYGTISGRIKTSPMTYLRVSTDDLSGKIVAYVGEGKFTKDPLKTFGGYGVVEIPNFQKLLAYICNNGFEHHVAVSASSVSAGVSEALSKYLGWSVYNHA
jgi:L-fucose isomerase-like protein